MVRDKFMDMDVYKVDKILKNNHIFVSPLIDSSCYFIVAHDDIKEMIIELYWKQLKYAEKNIGYNFIILFTNFMEGVNKKTVKSSIDMCQRLIVESFVLLYQDAIGCCLSNNEFMFGYYIEYKWNCEWNLIYSCIC